MKYCSECGKEISEETTICSYCGYAVIEATTSQEIENDKVSIGLCVVSALFSLFGIIYWAVKRKEAPKRSLACLITAIISWVISYVFL